MNDHHNHEKSTTELEQILKQTHPDRLNSYFEENADSMVSDRPFSDYIKSLIHRNGLKQQDIFLEADIPERYGYKLLSEEKHTRQRDVILRLCYASNLTLDETQHALKLYQMPELYAKVKRDALIMIAFNQRPGSIIDVNTFLKNNGVEVLRSSGTQE